MVAEISLPGPNTKGVYTFCFPRLLPAEQAKSRGIARYLYFCPHRGQQKVAWGWSPAGA